MVTWRKIRNARSKRGTEVIEKMPSDNEVISFLENLRPLCNSPLTDQFFISNRDETICVRHEISDPPRELYLKFPVADPLPPVYIDLVTVTQDYTSRSNKSFTKDMQREDYLKKNGVFRAGWPEYGVEVPDMVRLISPHFNPLQNYLLERQERYLHVIRVDPIPKDKVPITQIVYYIETARRHRSESEGISSSVDLREWDFMTEFKRSKAKEKDITFWAIQELVPTSAENDSIRLEYIQSVIETEQIRQNIREAYSEKYLSREPIPVKGGNHISMLRARRAGYLDGRARFPVMCAALKDKSLTRPQPLNSPMEEIDVEQPIARSVFVPGVTHSLNHQEIDPEPTFKEAIIRYDIIGKSAAVVVLSIIGSCLYLTRLPFKPEEGETVRSNTITLFFGLMTLFEGLLIFYEYTQGRGLRRPVTGADVWKQAVRFDKIHGTKRARIEAVCHPCAKTYFTGENLSFVGGEDLFTGNVTVGCTFSLVDLLRAGYETTFSRDGSEILLGPKQRNRKMFRVQEIDEDQRARLVEVKTFELDSVVSDKILGTQTLDFTRGAWYQNIDFA